MGNVLEVTNLKKKFRNNRGIESVSFKIDKGDIFGLLGSNGAGKTTTMKIIAGLLQKDSGDVSVFDNSIDEHFEEVTYNIGSLIEMPSFYGYMSAEQNMKVAAKYYLNSGITLEEIHEKLKLVKLYEYKSDKTKRYSLGMKQRLGLALAMIGNPKLYILDEPSNGLDIEGIIEIRNIILELAKNHEASFLLSSHQAAEIQKTCNKVGVIHNGILKDVSHIDNILQNFPSVEDYYLHCVKGGEEQ